MEELTKRVSSKNSIAEISSPTPTEFTLEEFAPEIYDCEADGSCGSGHLHNRV